MNYLDRPTNIYHDEKLRSLKFVVRTLVLGFKILYHPKPLVLEPERLNCVGWGTRPLHWLPNLQLSLTLTVLLYNQAVSRYTQYT
ncbi:hypothetical protein ACE1AT_17955 [Pelatocladus sp. BLCC-F211]|uniref:hypothetical protein n=1 Tax=Pelatocladus sp. BLCC-F211 TaxID=3342752 RepID=UPI0035B87B46